MKTLGTQSRHSKGTPQGSNALQQVIIKYDRTKYRKVRQLLISMDLTVSSFIRAQFDDLIERHSK